MWTITIIHTLHIQVHIQVITFIFVRKTKYGQKYKHLWAKSYIREKV